MLASAADDQFREAHVGNRSLHRSP
jgi:hypothetical protein